jgi:hypothetical protein
MAAIDQRITDSLPSATEGQRETALGLGQPARSRSHPKKVPSSQTGREPNTNYAPNDDPVLKVPRRLDV